MEVCSEEEAAHGGTAEGKIQKISKMTKDMKYTFMFISFMEHTLQKERVRTFISILCVSSLMLAPFCGGGVQEYGAWQPGEVERKPLQSKAKVEGK